MLMIDERELLVSVSKKAYEAGLCPGTSGNFSLFDHDRGVMAITPSGVNYPDMYPSDIVIMDLEGDVLDGGNKPSSEWALHSIFYKNRNDVSAVVHTHSLYCTTYAVLERPIETLHYAMAGAGVTRIPCIPYVLFGSEELAERAYEGCGMGNAVLLGHHGIVCLGSDIESAYSLANNIEYTARLQYQAENIGSPRPISDADMTKVIEQFSHYGQKDSKKTGY